MSDKVNLVRVLTSATGNSTPITLGAAYSALFMTPAEAGAVNGRTYTYLIVDGNDWELGKGVYTSSGTTLARTTILASRISGTLGTTRITLSGTAQVRFVESAQDMDGVRGTRTVSGTSDTIANNDQGFAITYSNASAIAASLAQAGASSQFLDGWAVNVKNTGVGTLTITPATSTINGASSLVLPTNLGAFIWSDGTNYHAFVFSVASSVAGVRASLAIGGQEYENKFRNPSFDVWQRGTSLSGVSGGYTADGWIVGTTGASVAVAQVANPKTNPLTAWGLKITGATSVTDASIKQRIESFIAAPLAGQSVTFQMQVRNDTGGSITPTITVKHPTSAPDGFGSLTTDVSAQNLQACANGATTQVSYTFTAAANTINGLEITVDFGNNFSTSGKSVTVSEADIRVGSVVQTPAFRSYGAELALNQRYYYRRQSQHASLDIIATVTPYSSTSVWGKVLDFPVTMRVAPSVSQSSLSHLSISSTTVTSGSFDGVSNSSICMNTGLTATGAGLTTNGGTALKFNTASGWIDATAEL